MKPKYSKFRFEKSKTMNGKTIIYYGGKYIDIVDNVQKFIDYMQIDYNNSDKGD